MEEKAIKFYGLESDAKKPSSIFFESEIIVYTATKLRNRKSLQSAVDIFKHN